MTRRNTIVSGLSLFTSFGTLICCALPALFVSLGAGAVLAGVVANVPQLVWLSERKGEIFLVAGTMLLLSGVMRYRSRNAPCPIEPGQARACMKLRRFSGIIFYASAAIYGIGFFFAFLAASVF